MRPQDWERLPWPARQRLQREALKRYQAAQEATEATEKAERRREQRRAAERRCKRRKRDSLARCGGCGSWTWTDQACTTCQILAETRHLPSAREAQHADEAHWPAQAQERQDSEDLPHPAGTARR